MRRVLTCRWCSGTSVKKAFRCSQRNSSYLRWEAWLQGSSSQVSTENVRNDLWPLQPPPAVKSVCLFRRWAGHLWGPLIGHPEKPFAGPAAAGGCDKVQGVSNEISPWESVWFKLIFWSGWSCIHLWWAELSTLTFCILFSHHSSEENEFNVNTAAIRTIGDVLCKLWDLKEAKEAVLCLLRFCIGVFCCSLPGSLFKRLNFV